MKSNKKKQITKIIKYVKMTFGSYLKRQKQKNLLRVTCWRIFLLHPHLVKDEDAPTRILDLGIRCTIVVAEGGVNGCDYLSLVISTTVYHNNSRNTTVVIKIYKHSTNNGQK